MFVCMFCKYDVNKFHRTCIFILALDWSMDASNTDVLLWFIFCVKFVMMFDTLLFYLQYIFIRSGFKVDGWKWEISCEPFPNGSWKCPFHYFHWWNWFFMWSTWRRQWKRSFKENQDWTSCANAGEFLIFQNVFEWDT